MTFLRTFHIGALDEVNSAVLAAATGALELEEISAGTVKVKPSYADASSRIVAVTEPSPGPCGLAMRQLSVRKLSPLKVDPAAQAAGRPVHTATTPPFAVGSVDRSTTPVSAPLKAKSKRTLAESPVRRIWSVAAAVTSIPGQCAVGLEPCVGHALAGSMLVVPDVARVAVSVYVAADAGAAGTTVTPSTIATAARSVTVMRIAIPSNAT